MDHTRTRKGHLQQILREPQTLARLPAEGYQRVVIPRAEQVQQAPAQDLKGHNRAPAQRLHLLPPHRAIKSLLIALPMRLPGLNLPTVIYFPSYNQSLNAERAGSRAEPSGLRAHEAGQDNKGAHEGHRGDGLLGRRADTLRGRLADPERVPDQHGAKLPQVIHENPRDRADIAHA